MHHHQASRSRFFASNLLIAFAFLLGISAAIADEITFGTENGFSYSSDGSEITITRTPVGVTTIVFPSTIQGLPVTTIGTDVVHPISRTNVQEVTIPEGVTTFAPAAFQRCGNLTTINFPASLREIGASAFLSCNSLKSVRIESGLSEVGSRAFAFCAGLESVYLEGTVTSLDGTFEGCAALTEVRLPAGLLSIDRVFVNCIALSEIDLPPGIESMDGAFLSCTSLTEIELPPGLVSMAAAFRRCTGLTSIEIPGTVEDMREAFEDCIALETVTINPGVETISISAFEGCSNLTEVNLPASVLSLESGAFRECSSLVGISLPAGLEVLGRNAFYECTSLQAIDIPGGVKTIEVNAFQGCTSLETVILRPGLEVIAGGAFGGCSSLRSVIFPVSLRSIGGQAFDGADLRGLEVPDNVTAIGDKAFDDLPNLTTVTLPEPYLASISRIGIDSNPGVATDYLIRGIADNLANNEDFIARLADTIIAKEGHFGIGTQQDLDDLGAEIPDAIRAYIAEDKAERLITSDLDPLKVVEKSEVSYQITTNFGATAFDAVGLPPGLTIDRQTGLISGKSRSVGAYEAILHAGVSAGEVTSSVKVFEIEEKAKTPRRRPTGPRSGGDDD